nr:MAG TPA: hypothetical protein [Caudoviricetes sp.]
MNKQEILDEINKTKEHLANMEKMLAECEYERWKPEHSKEYWIVDSWGMIYNQIWTNSNSDQKRYDFYNCFQTREQAEVEAEKILVRRQLEDIARRLNKGQKIDWNDDKQFKYSICINSSDNEITWDSEVLYISQGVVYCLDMNFYNVAIQEIGEERLKKYLRGE